MNNLVYLLVTGIAIFVALIIAGSCINIKRQKELRDKLRFKVVYKD